jgi:hypothetical protein
MAGEPLPLTARVRETHVPIQMVTPTRYFDGKGCEVDRQPWPCDAIQLLDRDRAAADSLDAAWSEAEAATLAWGSADRFVSLDVLRGFADAGHPVVYTATADRIEHREPGGPPASSYSEEADGSTPAAALRSLAARLREVEG